MLLLGTFVGFLILLDITTVSHADPKDIHIYLHGLRKSANKPRVEAGIAETNTEATGESGESGGEEESNRGFGENGCSPEWNRNSYKLIGQLITHQSPCSGNSPKYSSPSGILQPFEPITGLNMVAHHHALVTHPFHFHGQRFYQTLLLLHPLLLE
eukprot:TRINITY_DN13875_c0_g1_i7.p1 TRINITY_DN13875_c0_g1~~TRINITY_DN13875_c0_g1_i7.p1  ORF type:complete len:156 (+),score=31.61 TRINITY_DN13875_c0_g1_i7:75-542(+)